MAWSLRVPIFYVLIVLTRASAAKQTATYIIQTLQAQKPTVFADSKTWHRTLVGNQNVIYDYTNVLHGFSARLTPAEAMSLSRRGGVVSVRPQVAYNLHTTRTPEFLGLSDVPQRLWNESKQGTGIIIALLDTGAWPESRSFADSDMEAPPSRWKGDCVSPNFTCNNKIIGARFYRKAYDSELPEAGKKLPHTARDIDGHGTHTASTAAGVPVTDVSLNGYARGTARGVAPKAWIAVYKVCWNSRCFNADILAAADAALDDGVDVISISIGGSPLDFYADYTSIAALSAAEKGVFVAFSAGNDGPDPWSVVNVAPWLTTVAAGSIDRDFLAVLTLGDGREILGKSLFNAPALPPGKLFPLVDALTVRLRGSNKTLAKCCFNGTIDSSLAAGKILVCEAGDTNYDEIGVIVKTAGAVGMVMVNNKEFGEAVNPIAHVLPALNLGYTDGSEVRNYVLASKDATASIRSLGTETGLKPAPSVAIFSSRGPNSIAQQVLKPDITAPGVSIIAAFSESHSSASPGISPVPYNIISGTSMACPHIAGIGALLKSAHPHWSPAAIKSAMMTTAFVTANDGRPILDSAGNESATPFAMGVGYVDAEKALNPGLVYDAGVEDYVAFLCSINYTDAELTEVLRKNFSCSRNVRRPLGSPGDLNYPSFSVIFPNGTAGKTVIEQRRTVTNVGAANCSYLVQVKEPKGLEVAVKPSRLDFRSVGEKHSFVVRFTAKRLPISNEFGVLFWTDGVHGVRSPIVASSWATPPTD